MASRRTIGEFELSIYEKGDPVATKLALVLPGRLESKDYTHIRSHVDLLAGLGFHAVTFDPPGSWESAGKITDYTLTNYLRAANEVITYYGSKPTLLVGHSLGGSVAIRTAANNSHVVGLVLLMTAAYDEPYQDVEWQQQGFVRFDRDVPPGDKPGLKQRHYDLPYSYIEGIQQQPISTVKALQKCKQPKLFILGTHDSNTLPEDVRRTYAIAPGPKQLVEVPSHHGYRYSERGIREINALIRSFVSTLELA